MSRAVRDWGIGVVVMAVGTVLGGWWTLVVVAALWSVTIGGRPLLIGLAGAGAWAVLLLIRGVQGPVLAVSDRVGGVLGAPGWAPIVITVLFAFLLAWSAAAGFQRTGPGVAAVATTD